ncbi:MAG: 50S ribosomal protein L24 [Candidatus Hydrogenedentota bacterium]|nr:MAG: 50S ribosomal protein L24 [Candidatus Hydrogenedentota bacterium]
MATRLKRGMEVVVISGAEKGKTGKILHIDHEKGRVIVEGVKMIQRAARPSQANPTGGFVEREGSLSISNVAAVDPAGKSGSQPRPTKIGFRMRGGEKVRFARASGEIIEVTGEGSHG